MDDKRAPSKCFRKVIQKVCGGEYIFSFLSDKYTAGLYVSKIKCADLDSEQKISISIIRLSICRICRTCDGIRVLFKHFVIT